MQRTLIILQWDNTVWGEVGPNPKRIRATFARLNDSLINYLSLNVTHFPDWTNDICLYSAACFDSEEDFNHVNSSSDDSLDFSGDSKQEALVEYSCGNASAFAMNTTTTQKTVRAQCATNQNWDMTVLPDCVCEWKIISERRETSSSPHFFRAFFVSLLAEGHLQKDKVPRPERLHVP